MANSANGNIHNVCAAGNCAGTITDGGYNISDDASFEFTDPTSKDDTEPKLDPIGLANNGGPTQTIALLPTSPAVNAIPPGINGCTTTVTTDQRGVSRPQGPACDIGTFELEQASPTPPHKHKKKGGKGKKKHSGEPRHGHHGR